MSGPGDAAPDRRPIPQRDTGWARAVTRWLAARGVAPNRISQASVLAAALAGAAFWASAGAEGLVRAGLLVAAAGLILLRLLCNMFDGLVAVEAGRKTPDGPFWNEVPDRVADLLILVGAGLGAGWAALGWAAGAAAVLTAYVREMGRALGAPSDFRGPMAKPHRMFALVGAALLAALEPLWGGQGEVLLAALWLILIGTAVTVWRRARGVLDRLGG